MGWGFPGGEFVATRPPATAVPTCRARQRTRWRVIRHEPAISHHRLTPSIPSAHGLSRTAEQRRSAHIRTHAWGLRYSRLHSDASVHTSPCSISPTHPGTLVTMTPPPSRPDKKARRKAGRHLLLHKTTRFQSAPCRFARPRQLTYGRLQRVRSAISDERSSYVALPPHPHQ